MRDPRVTFVGPLQRYLMTYTAWSSHGPRIALAVSKISSTGASGLATFASTDGIEFGNVDDKDASLFRPLFPIHQAAELALLHRPLFPVPVLRKQPAALQPVTWILIGRASGFLTAKWHLIVSRFAPASLPFIIAWPPLYRLGNGSKSAAALHRS